MRNFFVQSRGLSFTEVSLQSNNIIFIPFNYDGHAGWLFDENAMNTVCQTFNVHIADTRTTTMDGLELAILQARGAETARETVVRAEPVTPAPAPEEVATLTTVVEEVAAPSTTSVGIDMSSFEEHLGKKILIHNVEGTYVKPIKDDNYHIWIYATPDSKNPKPEANAPRILFNLRWSREFHSFAPSGKGTIITDDAANPMAELVNDNNLYVLHPLRYIENVRRPDFRVLQALIIKTIMGDDKYIELIRNFTFDQAKTPFTEFCKKMEFRRLDELKSSVATLKTKVAEIGGQYVKLSNDLKGSERELIMYTNDAEKQVGSYLREFERIKNNPKVTNLEISDHEIIVTTVPLTCEDPRNGAIHSMGQYRIKINMGGPNAPQSFGLNLENLTRKIDNKSHPHTHEDGKPCMGNFNEVLPSLVMANEYSALVIMSIKFIESVETNDQWGKTIVKWPIDPSSPVDPTKKKESRGVPAENADEGHADIDEDEGEVEEDTDE